MAARAPVLTGARGWPVVTAGVLLAAAAALLIPGAPAALLYDREQILAGQVWRLWTGHVVHFSAEHFRWNALVVGVAGSWLERVARRPTVWFYAVAPVVISGVLLAGDSALWRYAGLSGLATGLVVALALDRLRAGGREPIWLWRGVFGVVAAKLILELLLGAEFFVSFDGGVRPVPLAHLAGAGIAWGGEALVRRRMYLKKHY